MKKGKLAEKNWTIKEIKGKCYLYTWEFDQEATDKKREEMRKEMIENPFSGIRPIDLGTKASRYKWKSHGQWNLEKPSDKLMAYIQSQSYQTIAEIELEVRKRTEQKQYA